MKLLLLIVAACAVIVPIQGNNKLCFVSANRDEGSKLLE